MLKLWLPALVKVKVLVFVEVADKFCAVTVPVVVILPLVFTIVDPAMVPLVMALPETFPAVVMVARVGLG